MSRDVGGGCDWHGAECEEVCSHARAPVRVAGSALLKKILCVICLVGVGACAWPVDCIVVILATNDRLFLVLGKVLVRDMKGFEHHRTWPKSCTLEVEAV